MKKAIVLAASAALLLSLASCTGKAEPPVTDPAITNATSGTIATEETNITSDSEAANVPTEDHRLTDYAVVLGNYRTAIKEKWDYGKLMENEMSELLALGYDTETVGYAFVDLDGDGVDELIFGAMGKNGFPDAVIYDMYSLVDNNETHIFSSHERDRFYLASLTDSGKDYTLVSFGSSGASSSVYEGVKFDGGKLSVYQAVRFDGAETNPWMTGVEENGEVVYKDAVTEEVGKGIMDSAQNSVVTPSYIALGE